MLEAIQKPGEPTIVPVGGRGEAGVAVLVGRLPGEPERRDLFDDLGVVAPADRDLARQGVPAPDPVDPTGELCPELLCRPRTEVAPAPGRRWRPGFCTGLDALDPFDEADEGVGALVGEVVQVPAQPGDCLCLAHELGGDRVAARVLSVVLACHA